MAGSRSGCQPRVPSARTALLKPAPCGRSTRCPRRRTRPPFGLAAITSVKLHSSASAQGDVRAPSRSTAASASASKRTGNQREVAPHTMVPVEYGKYVQQPVQRARGPRGEQDGPAARCLLCDSSTYRSTPRRERPRRERFFADQRWSGGVVLRDERDRTRRRGRLTAPSSGSPTADRRSHISSVSVWRRALVGVGMVRGGHLWCYISQFADHVVRSTAVPELPSATHTAMTSASTDRRRTRTASPQVVEERELHFEGFRFVVRVVFREEALVEPLVVLGGSSQDRLSWVRHERWFSEVASVVTVDLPGYGEADFLPARYGLDFLARAVRHALSSLGMARVNVAGACFGGAIAMRLAQLHPDCVARLLLVGMARQLPADYAEIVDRWRGQVAAGQLTDIADELVSRFTAESCVGVVRRRSAVARFLRREFLDMDAEALAKWVEHNSRLVAHDWYRSAPIPAVPTLVVTGEYDTLTPPGEGRVLATSLPSASFTTIREADHLAPVERVGEFAELVCGFCCDTEWWKADFCGPVEMSGTL